MSKPIKAINISDKPLVVDDPAMKSMVGYVNIGKYDEAIKWIQNKKIENEQLIRLVEPFDAYPSDGGHAFYAVMKQVYGWVEQKPTPGFFGDTPPSMLRVETSWNTAIEIPWGWVMVPNIEGKMHLGAVLDGGVQKFRIHAEIKKKHLHLVRELCDRTREYLKTGSIYRGQPVKMSWVEEEGGMFTSATAAFDTPKFMAPTGFGKEDLILPRPVFEEVNATIFSLIEKAGKARQMGVPTKRLVLAAGKYGTGKTLTATITAELCRKHQRTFFYLHDVRHLADLIHVAKQYPPACIFGEDIDGVTDPEIFDLISNTIDGIDTKTIDILFILTTNHVNRIPEKFLRSGRSDMIIKFTPPDAEAAARLIMKYGGETLANDFTFEDALKLAGPLAEAEMIPASIREVVERSKLFALAYDREAITNVDLARASHGVLEQCDMLKEKRPSLLPDHLEEVGTLVRAKAMATNGH